MPKPIASPAFLKRLTIIKVMSDPLLKKRVLEYFDSIDHEIVLPPDRPRPGDEFMSRGELWEPVTPKTYNDMAFGENSYLVRRPTEHLRMMRFFAGNKKW